MKVESPAKRGTSKESMGLMVGAVVDVAFMEFSECDVSLGAGCHANHRALPSIGSLAAELPAISSGGGFERAVDVHDDFSDMALGGERGLGGGQVRQRKHLADHRAKHAGLDILHQVAHGVDFRIGDTEHLEILVDEVAQV